MGCLGENRNNISEAAKWYELKLVCYLIISLVLALALLAMASVKASAIPPPPTELTLEHLVTASDLIVVGEVTDVTCSAEGGIHTWVTLAVEHIIKGDCGQEVVIRVQGGVVGGIVLRVEEAPEFVSGERAILFLKKYNDDPWYEGSQDIYQVIGSSRGKWTVGRYDSLVNPVTRINEIIESQGITPILVLPLSLDELITKADLILIGEVSNTDCSNADKGNSYSLVTLAVEDNFVGDYQPEVTIQINGGQVDGSKVWLEEAPNFRVGERVVVFLEEISGSSNTNYLGKITLRDDMGRRIADFSWTMSRVTAAVKAQGITPKWAIEEGHAVLPSGREEVVLPEEQDSLPGSSDKQDSSQINWWIVGGGARWSISYRGIKTLVYAKERLEKALNIKTQ